MFRKQIRENLRRLDVGCAKRARWLGVRKMAERPPFDEAEEKRLRMKEEARRSLCRMDGFNRR